MMSGSVPGLKGKTVEISLISRDRDIYIHIRAYNTFYNTDFYFFLKKAAIYLANILLGKVFISDQRERIVEETK